MTPTERQRLAEALTAATGHEWYVGRHDVDRREGDGLPPISIDCHQRQHSIAIADNYSGSFIEILRQPYVGRGWIDRLVADVLPHLDKALTFRSYREKELIDALTAATGLRWSAPAKRTPYERARCDATGVMVLYSHHENAVYVQVPGGGPGKSGDFRDATGPGYWRVVASAVVSAVRMLMPASPSPSARDRRRVEHYRRLVHPDSGACDSERAQAREHLGRMTP